MDDDDFFALGLEPDHGPPEAHERWKNSPYIHSKSRKVQPSLLFRYDDRKPEDIFNHGFKTKLESGGGDIMSASFVVSRHTDFAWDDTAYISFSRSLQAVLSGAQNIAHTGKAKFFGVEDWLKIQEHGRQHHDDATYHERNGPPPPAAELPEPAYKTEKWGYIVRPNSKFISFFGTLGPAGFSEKEFISEQDYGSIGHVSSNRIIGAFRVSDGQLMVQFNLNYDHRFDSQRASKGYPGLAFINDKAIAEQIINGANRDDERLKALYKSPIPTENLETPMPLSEVVKKFTLHTPRQDGSLQNKGSGQGKLGGAGDLVDQNKDGHRTTNIGDGSSRQDSNPDPEKPTENRQHVLNVDPQGPIDCAGDNDCSLRTSKTQCRLFRRKGVGGRLRSFFWR
ncbi:hypothetical protein DCS_05357 [Drechmeria coniospora]|uniref:Uncharacterized protein n=1 Tax=Drechmeria coniospora TaxID=98403 RepID=A0A151GMJ4_DRECN|nr:hypothetical protein DCS_05357 [Drechmeria coniospora]KYK58344.1 hypothetical protein DCS_05357 [Drechmeria coniospora]